MVVDLDANKVVLTVVEKVELWVDHSVALLVDEMVDLLVVLLVAVWDVMRVEEKLNWMVVMENV